jgi:hypothetical protein
MVSTIIELFNNGAALKEISEKMYGTPYLGSNALHQLKIWAKVYPGEITRKIK